MGYDRVGRVFFPGQHAVITCGETLRSGPHDRHILHAAEKARVDNRGHPVVNYRRSTETYLTIIDDWRGVGAIELLHQFALGESLVLLRAERGRPNSHRTVFPVHQIRTRRMAPTCISG